MCRVMFIDDDPMVLRMASFIMKKSGNQALTASSGDEGIMMIRSEQPQLVFIDAEMPEKNGFETLEEIKKDESLKALPVCIMSGTITDELRERAKALGAADMIGKPLQAAQVIDIISAVCKG